MIPTRMLYVSFLGLTLLCLSTLPLNATAQIDPLAPAKGVQADSDALSDVDLSSQNADTEAAGPITINDAGLDAYNRGVELFQIAQNQAEKGNLKGQKDLLRQAIKNFEDALYKSPDLVEAQSNVGFAWLTLKDYKKAIQAFEKALALNDKHLNTLNGLSTAYAFKGDTPAALKTFDKLTTLDPANPEYFFNKGSVLQKENQLEEAKEAYQEALRLEPDDQRSLFNLGTLYENLGELDAAKTYYEKSKSVNISNAVGLESIHRLEGITSLMAQKTASETTPANTTPSNKNDSTAKTNAFDPTQKDTP